MKKFVFLSTILGSIILSSCNIQDYNQEVDETVENEVKNNEEVEAVEMMNIAMRPTATLNPLLVKDVTNAVNLNLMYDELLEINTDGQYSSSVATGTLYNKDGNYYEVYLDNEVYFANGDKVTSYDVAYSIDTMKNAEIDSYYYDIGQTIGKYEVISESQINIYPINIDMHTNVRLDFPIISDEKYEDAPIDIPYGTGVYTYSGDMDSKHIGLIDNPNDSRQPNIKEVQMIVMPDAETEFYAFEQGIIDVTFSSVTEWAKYRKENDPQIIKVDTNELEYIGFNFNDSRFSNVDIREMISFVIDYDLILNEVYLSYGSFTNTGVNPNSVYYNENSIEYIYDNEMARTILKENGYYFNSSALDTEISTSDNIFTVDILVNEENEDRVNTATVIANELNHIGVETNIISVPYDDYIYMLDSGQYDIVLAGTTVPPNQDYTNILLGSNPFRLDSEELQLAHQQLKSSVGETEYIKNMYNIQNIIRDNVYIIPILFREDGLIVNGEIQNIRTTPNNPFYNVDEWVLMK